MNAQANCSRRAPASGTDLAQAMTLGPGTRAVFRPIAPPPLPPPDRTWNDRRVVWTRIATAPDHTPIRPTLGLRRHGPLTRRGGLDARGYGLGLGEGRQIRLRPLNLPHLQVPRLVQQPNGHLQGVNEAEEVLALGRMESVRRGLGAQDIAPCLGPRAGAGPAMHPAAAVPHRRLPAGQARAGAGAAAGQRPQVPPRVAVAQRSGPVGDWRPPHASPTR